MLLGAIGLAIGAGIASTFATTEVETEWMGEQGAAAREKLQGAVAEGKERARKVVADVQEEAARQGLTLDAAKGFREVGRRKSRQCSRRCAGIGGAAFQIDAVAAFARGRGKKQRRRASVRS